LLQNENTKVSSADSRGNWIFENHGNDSLIEDPSFSNSLGDPASHSLLFPSVFQEASVITTTTTTVSKSQRLHSAQHRSESGVLPKGRLNSSSDYINRPKTSGGNRNDSSKEAFVLKAGFKMPQRPNSSHHSLLSASNPQFPSMF
jgi:hypothetical protein